MNHKHTSLAIALVLALGSGIAQAQSQDNVVKVGVTLYNPHSKTDGITGVGVPPGADAKVRNATTVIFVYERLVNPNVGVEFVLGVPPTIKAKATGTVSFLGDDVLSAKNVAPTLLLNYHFGSPGDTWRPYLGAGINYTKFTNAKSILATDVKLGDSWGPAVQGGINYAITKDWGLFASVAYIDVKSKVVASGTTVLTTKIDFRPLVYSFGGYWQF
ncbi:MAG: OmpW family outer membrane protein [Caldimonas sp.]